ncbi:site-specific integrase [Burkholderia sp. Bp8963]|uniref:tyrosine-type recombinase/integrase n=1 Tax=Burkholderia sp. Bp8963 TaxID=2184547 RepID=UPI000F5A6875|nr:tyrosine-type recombinase/integrase [Burkholderia sp. Bp8963]RQS63398.1 site-specific integrase [Burkholderia sp. Bp8963]
MDKDLWIRDPASAFRAWQETEATGADRRPFAPRSIVQHVAMFDRFLRYLLARGVTPATFGPEHVEGFLADLDRTCAPDSSTRARYAKLIDRISRQLVSVGLREANPAERMARYVAWPDGEPEPVCLPPDADNALQAYVRPRSGDGPVECRNHAIVALLLGSGITSREIRTTTIGALDLDAGHPTLYVPQHGARPERQIALERFARRPLEAWRARGAGEPASALLFPAPRSGQAMNDMFLLLVVRDALTAIGFDAPDMSPRVLRNTYARRQLLAGRSHADVNAMLGLVTSRTVVRIQQTLPRDIDARDADRLR